MRFVLTILLVAFLAGCWQETEEKRFPPDRWICTKIETYEWAKRRGIAVDTHCVRYERLVGDVEITRPVNN